jgi:hypothetical protein
MQLVVFPLKVLVLTGYGPASITDHPYNDSTPASPTHPPLPELPQLCACKVSLFNTLTGFSTVLMTNSNQLTLGPSTSYSPHDI